MSQELFKFIKLWKRWEAIFKVCLQCSNKRKQYMLFNEILSVHFVNCVMT